MQAIFRDSIKRDNLTIKSTFLSYRAIFGYL